jgi:hypothetical protein
MHFDKEFDRQIALRCKKQLSEQSARHNDNVPCMLIEEEGQVDAQAPQLVNRWPWPYDGAGHGSAHAWPSI